MSIKYELNWNGTKCVFTTFDALVDCLREDFFEGELYNGDKLIITAVDMTDDEVEALGDFQGW
jgi:hypothetical protein